MVGRILHKFGGVLGAQVTITQNTPVLVAIDIAKARYEVLIAVPGKKRRRRLTVLNELADFTRLITA